MSLIDYTWRFNPFTQSITTATKTEYLYVQEVRSGLYGVQLTECPIKKSANYVTVKDVTNTDPDSPTFGTIYSEVDRTISPGSSQFRVDYDQVDANLTELVGYYSTGIVELNPSESGKMVQVVYDGTGRTVTFSDVADMDSDNEFSIGYDVFGNYKIYRRVIRARGGGSSADIEIPHGVTFVNGSVHQLILAMGYALLSGGSVSTTTNITGLQVNATNVVVQRSIAGVIDITVWFDYTKETIPLVTL